MRNTKSSTATVRAVKKEPIVIDLDSDDEDVLCGELNECMMDTEQTDVSIESGEANPSNMQTIFCAATNDGVDDWDNKVDRHYMKLFDSCREDGNSYLRDNPLRSIRYEVDNGGYDKREFKAAKDKQKSREDRNTIRATKKNVVESRPRVQASTKKITKEGEFELRRRESPVIDKSVDAMVNTSHARRNSQHNFEARKKEISDAEMVPDEHYRSYLTSLVGKWTSSRTNSEKEIQVKCEDDAMSLSDSDIIAVDDRPFLDEEYSPFVPSKSLKVVDLEEENDDGGQCSSLFRKEIMNVLKQPYNEEEFKELEQEASVCRWLTKCTELLDGSDLTYETNQKKPSYLDQYPEFKRKLDKSLDGNDRHRALNLLRGFIFYLTKVARHDAFKPWLDRECLKITCFWQRQSTSSSSA